MFQKASAADKRLKLFLWGPTGSGKTRLALEFPCPVVIDMEHGTEWYGDETEFDVKHCTTADEVMEAVDWLRTSRHEFATLIIDPITVYWEALQRKWSDIFLLRRTGTKGHKHEFYDFQPGDWQTIKGELRELIRKLTALDMNVVVTARQKILYAEGGFMQKAGVTFDGEKSLDYLFDVVLQLAVAADGERMCKVRKDRTHKLAAETFKTSIDAFSPYGDTLARAAEPEKMATSEQKQSIRNHLEKLGVDPAQVKSRLAAYGAGCLDDLTEDNARIILSKLEP